MLEITEKVVWILSLLVIACGGAWFALAGPPSTRPLIGTNSTAVSLPELGRTLPASGRQKLDEIKGKPQTTADGKRSGPTRKVVAFAIDKPMFEKITNKTDAFREANKAAGELTDRGTWVIHSFDKDNLFERIGFEEDDEIESIDGIAIDMNTAEAWGVFSDLTAKFESGESIYVDVKRNGKPTRIWFGPDESFGFATSAAKRTSRKKE